MVKTAMFVATVILCLPPMPSFGDWMTVGLASVHLVGDCCIFQVSFFGISACCTGVVWSNVKAM